LDKTAKNKNQKSWLKAERKLGFIDMKYSDFNSKTDNHVHGFHLGDSAVGDLLP